MKRTSRCCLGCFGLIVLCLPLAVWADDPPPAQPTAPGETYVVKKGDTLWGIAKGLLSDPVLWPRIWEQNPFITDPNRIFPGDTLAVPGSEAVPTEPAPAATAPVPEPPKEVQAEVKAPPPTPVAPPAPPAPADVRQVEIPPVPPASERAIACSPVVVGERSADAAGVGSILLSEDDHELVSQENQLAVGLDPGRRAAVGDKLAVIRPGIRVVHPRARQSLGRILYTLGIIEVTGVRDRTVQGRVVFGCDPISPGDRVTPFVLAPFPEDKIAQPTQRSVEGTILESARPTDLLGLQQLIFLDAGTGRGIGPGDVFAVYRPNPSVVSPATGQEFQIPPDRLGEAVVLRVTEGTATAVITASRKEIQQGDRVVLSRQIQP